MTKELDWKFCVQCVTKYIEDCPYAGVDLEGKPEVPGKCWKAEDIKMIPRPHKTEIE